MCAATAPPLTGLALFAAGIVAGFIIGVIAALLGVAGGEFLIPTLILLFGADIKLAGSLSLAVSLPTMLVGFARYSRDQSFSVLHQNWPFMLAMVAGSMVGTLWRTATWSRSDLRAFASTGRNLSRFGCEGLATQVIKGRFRLSRETAPGWALLPKG